MAWIIGVDEAGYGPNLGPFIMCSIAWRVPDARAGIEGVDFWQLLAEVVCKGATRKPLDRVLLDDSKIVHGKKGLAGLERGVFALALSTTPATLGDLLQGICREGLAELVAEPWYTGTHPIPNTLPQDDLAPLRARLKEAMQATEIEPGPWHGVVVSPPHFNALTEAAGSKGAVLAHALQRLLVDLPQLSGDDPLYLFVDKHGGRNTYAALLQHAFDAGMVLARQESAARSVYEVLGYSRKITLSFQPKADTTHATVALASMAAKYLREQCMCEFNTFFQKHLPDLAPTAGYPLDAGRFLEAVRGLLPGLNLTPEQLWRKK